jgi:hypothetical protein
MKKMKFKSIVGLFSFAICISILSCTALANSTDSVPSSNYNSDNYNYISEKSTIQFAKNFIINQSAADGDCPWNSNTTISKKVPIYDLNSSINGYILNLKNNNKDVGYLIVYGFSENPSVDEFSYGGECYLLDNIKFSALKNHKIVGLGFENYGYIDDSNKLRDAYTNNLATTSEQNIKNNYKKFHNDSVNPPKLTKTSNQQSNLLPLISVRPLSTVSSTGSLYLPYVSKFYPRSQDYFPNGSGGCVPTSVVNMFKYWHDCRGKSTLVNKSDTSTWNIIIGSSYLNYPRGTQNNDHAYPAAQKYCARSDIASYAGSALNENPSFSWIKTNITNGNLIVLGINVCLISPTQSGGHNVDVVGYQIASGNQYAIVDNGWGNSINTTTGTTSWTWVRWPGDGSSLKGNAFYLRW